MEYLVLISAREACRAAPSGRADLAADQAPAVKRHRLAIAEVDVTQHPAGAVRPRQHPEGGRIGHHHYVGKPGELLDAETAAAGERGYEHLVTGVQAVDSAGEVEAVGQRRDGGLWGQHLAARHAVLVDDREPDRPQAKLADPGRDLLRRGLPRRASQVVLGHEARLPDTRNIRAHRAP